MRDTWWVEDRGSVKLSDPGLWLENMTETVVPIGHVGTPKTISAGEPFPITVYFWDDVIDAAYMSISLIPEGSAKLRVPPVIPAKAGIHSPATTVRHTGLPLSRE